MIVKEVEEVVVGLWGDWGEGMEVGGNMLWNIWGREGKDMSRLGD